MTYLSLASLLTSYPQMSVRYDSKGSTEDAIFWNAASKRAILRFLSEPMQHVWLPPSYLTTA